MDERAQGPVIHPVVIVGAGLFGLAIAHELRRRGRPPLVLDAAEEGAAAWRRRHPGLRLNTHRCLSSLPGLRMPRAAGAFPARDDVVRYLEAYEWRLERPVIRGVRVRRIEVAMHGWRLETSAGPVHAREVIVATGRERIPHVPAWPGRDAYRGELLTAAELGDAARFAGRDVLVVGAGTSGSDALNHLVGVGAARLRVSVRHGPTVLPARIAGVPLQLLSPLMTPLPARWVDLAMALTERVAFGDLRRHGLPRHADGVATRLLREGVGPAFDLGFVAGIRSGAIEVVPAVEALAADRVRLVDGREIAPDVVICATGYRPGLEAMVGHLGVLDARGIPRIAGPAGASARPGLYFAGMRPALPGQFLAARREARALARALAPRPRRASLGPRGWLPGTVRLAIDRGERAQAGTR